MFRTLVTAAALGLGAFTVTTGPALAVNHCVSIDISCQGHQCSGGDPIVNQGFNDTGPWIVICP
jgi:hypothetical protein